MLLKTLFLLVALSAIMLGYAIFIERNWFAVRRHHVPCLPAGAHPRTVLHISDLHLRAGQRRKRAFLRALATHHPDLIVATGDLLGDARSNDATIETLTALRGDARALFVLGSNDYYGPVLKNPLRYFFKRAKHIAGPTNPWEGMVSGLEANGWILLSNTVTEIGGADIVGVDDAHIGRADMSVAHPRTREGFRLAIAHSPDVAEEFARLDYNLILCGHTHGGQLCIPGFGAIITNCSLPREMASGLHRIGGAWLHVSAGLGTSMYSPFRFACRPEVCLLELVSENA